MKVDVNKLKGKMAEKQLTAEALATTIGIDGSTFYRKLKANGLTFTVAQMHRIAEVLQLSKEEATQIFLQ